MVRGVLHTHLLYIPEIIPPDNCILESVSTPRESIGVLWNPKGDIDGENVTVVGFVRLGYTEGLGPRMPVYYVEALTVEKS